ncbi:MAG: hypothetical protein TREMPRED_003673 [Tremellales sp. Tagirdzhanova-0007]|nr:MAG: hypothetical protein TREMPRED_003673 [Tremellales sp. Tagirdzhanova-0007]
MSTLVRSLSTVTESLPNLANPPFRDTLPSDFATSSKVTLDHFPVGEKGILIDDDPITSFAATDQDLMNAILIDGAVSDSPFSPQWTATIDPAFAFLCLRGRSSYLPFLRNVWPYLERLRQVLQPAMVFHLLVTDLLLWNPDPGGLRQLLELEANGNGLLRSGHIASVFSHIRTDIATDKSPPLSRESSEYLAVALMEEDEIDMLPDAWRNLFATTTSWEAESAWKLFQIILHLVQRDGVDDALRLVQVLVAGGLIPEAAFKKSNPRHPKAKALLVQSVILRCCLDFKIYDRAQSVAEEMAGTMEESEVSSLVSNLLLETCRATIAAYKTEEISWAGSFLRRLACIDGFPLIPASLVDAFIEVVYPPEAVNFFSSIPESKRPTISPHSILRLASGKRERTNLLGLMPFVNRLPSANFLAQRPGFLMCLAHARLARLARSLYHTWAGSFKFDADLMLELVRCFVSAEAPGVKVDGRPLSPRRQKAYLNDLAQSTHKIITDFNRLANPSLENRFALAQAKLLAGDPDSAQLILSKVDVSDPALPLLIDTLACTDMFLAAKIIRLSATAGNPLGSTADVVSRACASGRWSSLRGVKLSSLPADERREVSILRRICVRKFDSVLSELSGGSTVSATTLIALVTRSMGIGKTAVAMEAWNMAVMAYPSQPDIFLPLGYTLLRKLRELNGEDMLEDTLGMMEEEDPKIRLVTITEHLHRLSSKPMMAI